MSTSQAEHRRFHDGLERYYAYLMSLTGREDQFDGKALLEIIDGFSGPLHTHLTNEIGALLDLEKLGQTKAVMDSWAEGVKAGTSSITLYDFAAMMPFALFNHDMTYENGMQSKFPPIPGFLQFLMRRVASLWYSSYWKFSSCDTLGIPKELYARGSEG